MPPLTEARASIKNAVEEPFDVAGMTTAVFGPLYSLVRTFCNAVDAAQQTRPHGVSAGARSGSTGREAPDNHLLQAGDLASPFSYESCHGEKFSGVKAEIGLSELGALLHDWTARSLCDASLLPERLGGRSALVSPWMRGWVAAQSFSKPMPGRLGGLLTH